nr:hypothetical protein [Tanacetum cinerariifolium]GEX35167.1 hypothetical protein [Tanacetum cinerariifolium]
MDWSEMLPELLVVLAHKYIVYYEDYSSFARVCKSWHSAAVLATKGNKTPSWLPSLMLLETKGNEEYPKLSHLLKEAIPTTILASKGNGPPSRLPSLMLSEKKGDEEFRDLFLLSNETIRKIRLPEVYGKLCMSSCGWFVTVGDDHASQLINPLSREIFNLPKIDTFPRFSETSDWDLGIRKMVFLAPMLLVVVLWGCSGKLGFCRIGDKKWTHVDKGWHETIEDITFYNGRVYSFDCNCHIRAWDVYGEDPTQIVYVSRFPEDDDYEKYIDEAAYIIGLDDEVRKRLLVVVRKGMRDDDTEQHYETYMTKSFKVFEYDLASEKWSRVEDLGSKALFVGFNSSFWMEEDPAGAIKGNCIYFTDDAEEVYAFSKSGGGRDMGIYHLSDGAIESHFAGESRSHLTPPIWLQSI